MTVSQRLQSDFRIYPHPVQKKVSDVLVEELNRAYSMIENSSLHASMRAIVAKNSSILVL